MTGPEPVIVRLAAPEDRPSIYRLRHRVFAEELAQHPTHSAQMLTDELDQCNDYLVAVRSEQLLGFVSVTPPAAGWYSFQKYFEPGVELPFPVDPGLFEVRLLTIDPRARVDGLVYVLFCAAYHWCQGHGATRLAALGHDRVLPLYRSVGMTMHPLSARSGALRFHLISASVAEMGTRVREVARQLRPLLESVPYRWRLPMPLESGGA